MSYALTRIYLSSAIFHIDLDNVTTVSLEDIIIIYVHIYIYIYEWRRTIQLPSSLHHRYKQLACMKVFSSVFDILTKV